MRSALAESVPSHRWAWLAALASGIAWGACHAIETRPYLAALALAPLLVALGSARPFLVGWLSGTASWCLSIPWIVPTITTYGQLDGWVALLALLLLSLFLGLYQGLFGLLAAPLWRRGDLPSLAAIPALWVVSELARGWVFTGFPWNLASYAWTDLPGALPLTSWIGAWGLSALVVAANVGVARGFVLRRWEPAVAWLLVPATLLPVGARFATAPDLRHSGPPPVDVRVLQPDIPNRPYFDREANERDYERLLRMSRAVCEPGRLVVWPESAAWPRSFQEDPALRFDVDRLARSGCSLLFNSSWDVDGKTYNSVLLVAREGDGVAESAPGDPASSPPPGLRVDRADKRHLVPFGEYVPLRSALPFLGKIARSVGDFSPASEIRLLPIAGASDASLGAAVCFEVVFPGETAALARAGATLLVTVTNDAWYGDTAAPRQHLRAARFRAAENRRWLVRAAITGISAVVRPDGSLAGDLPVGEQGVLAAEVVPRTDRSPFTRAPWLVPALAVCLAAVGLARTRRTRADVSR